MPAARPARRGRSGRCDRRAPMSTFPGRLPGPLLAAMPPQKSPRPAALEAEPGTSRESCAEGHRTPTRTTPHSRQKSAASAAAACAQVERNAASIPPASRPASPPRSMPGSRPHRSRSATRSPPAPPSCAGRGCASPRRPRASGTSSRGAVVGNIMSALLLLIREVLRARGVSVVGEGRRHVAVRASGVADDGGGDARRVHHSSSPSRDRRRWLPRRVRAAAECRRSSPRSLLALAVVSAPVRVTNSSITPRSASGLSA